MDKSNNQIIHSLNGKQYLLVEVMCHRNADKEKIAKAVKDCGCIYQGFDLIAKETIWQNAVLKIKVLVPEENIEKFNTTL